MNCKARRHVGLLVFERCSVPNAGLIGEAFRLANELQESSDDEPAYRLSLLSSHGGNVRGSSSIALATEPLAAYALHDFDALFVACGDYEALAGTDPDAASWLSSSGCAPLDGYRHVENLAANVPGPVRSGVPVFHFHDAPRAAWSPNRSPVDVALAQIAVDLGPELAQRIARELHPPLVERSDALDEGLGMSTAAEKIQESARWIRENFDKSISITDAAAVAAMSNRNFLRRFKREMGVTPLEFLMRLRFELVSRLLTETELPVDKIARRCGMGNGDRLGRLFRKRHGISPTEYRGVRRGRREIAAHGASFNAFPAGTALMERRPLDNLES